MAEIARKGGTGDECNSATTQKTDVGSSDVFVEGVGVVREGDAMVSHSGPGCTAHAPTLSTFSGTVYVNNKKVGRKGDEYSGHVITSGSSKVFAG